MEDSGLPFDGHSFEESPDQGKIISAGAVPAAAGAIIDVHPDNCVVLRLNPRGGTNFDPIANMPLINKIRAQGQQVPVIVRRGVKDGHYDLVAGSRRLGAIRYLRMEDPALRLRAEVRAMSDEQAFLLAAAENEGRQDITEYEKAKSWAYVLDPVFGGSQRKLAAAVNEQEATISRMLALAALPDEIVALVTRPELLKSRFAEQIGPKLRDPEQRKIILGHASNLAASGQKFPPAELARQLLCDPGEVDEYRPKKIGAGRHHGVATWHRKENGSVHLVVKKLPIDLSDADRRELLKAISERLKNQVGVK